MLVFWYVIMKSTGQRGRRAGAAGWMGGARLDEPGTLLLFDHCVLVVWLKFIEIRHISALEFFGV